MSAPLPTIGSGESVTAAVDELARHDALVVLADGRPVGVLTRTDLLGFVVQ